MKPLVIFGACNAGDEYVQLFRDINEVHPEWDILGFVDDNEDSWGQKRGNLPVLGGLSWLKTKAPKGLHTIVGIGNTRAKRKVVAKVQECGIAFATGVHPSVITSPSNRIGAGTIVCAGCVLTTNVVIGNHVIVNVNTCIHHNTEIGDYCTINPGVAIAGDVIVGDSSYIGIGANVIDKMRIGRGVVIGGGATVISAIPDFTLAVGVPAKVIKTKENDLD
jgi:sugar O-acyltransferase (sialic acid O-acetyltransferase NeuD family)